MPRRLASLLLSTLFLLAPVLARAEVLNRIVLRVNDRIATLYDYQQRKDELVRDITRREQDPQERQRLLGQAGEMVFADLFRELLMDSRADQLGVEVTDAQVDQSIAQLKQNFNIKTPQDFAAALAQSGLTEPQLRAQVKNNLRMQEVRSREIQSRVKVDEEDLRRYYRKNLEQFRQPEQLQLREVVVLEEGAATADQRKAVAGQIRAKVQGGASLADAVADSAKKGTTSNVIELGWVSPGDLDKNLESAVWTLPVGALSEPVEARGGLHVVQVIDRRASRIPEFKEVSAAIQAREQERVYRDEVTKYMAELEKKSLIVANPPQDAAGYRSRLAAAAEGGEGGDLGAAAAAPPQPPAAAPANAAPADVAPGTLPGAPARDAKPQSPATTPPAGMPQPGTLPTPKPVSPTPPDTPPPGV
ncbi:MAG TPA: peptidyl-prolyl cis-trans isomerase [Thermoanaerobaculia bacterium]|jgi:parvulin-like peptidyl-prolyl isomerase|nr:peptidyl-prolyl cis-trans isomerase [Thermoanaerobaculia bacterium]